MGEQQTVDSKDLAQDTLLRNELTDNMVVMWAVVGSVAIILAEVRAYEIGWTLRDVIQHLAFVAIITVVFLRHRLSAAQKAVFLIGLNFALGVVGFTTLGMLAGGVFFFPLAAIIVALFYSELAITGFVLLTLLYLSLFALGFTSGHIRLTEDPFLLMMSMKHWSVYIFCLGYFFVVTCWTILRYRQTTDQLIVEVRAQRDELRQSEERLRTLAEAAFEGIVLIDNGKIIEANSTAAQMYGYASASDMIGERVVELVSPGHRQLVQQRIEDRYEEPYEAKGLRKDGTSFPVEVHGKMLTYQGRQVRVTAIRDLSERRKAEAEIRLLRGILPICASCKKIRDDKGYWNQIESYIREHSEAEFSHSVCPECARKLYPTLDMEDIA